MSETPLRIGIAGIGTVGAALVNILAGKADLLAARCGRAIVLSGVCARDRSRDRGVDLSSMQWFDDPVELARAPGIDIFVELMEEREGAA